MSDTPLTPVHLHTIAGDTYTAFELTNTATNANAFVGIGLFANAIANHVFIYSASFACGQSTSGEALVLTGVALDANFTVPITPFNLDMASINSPSVIVKGSPANTTATGTSGTIQYKKILPTTFETMEMFTNGTGILIPAGTVAAVNFYVRVPTANNIGSITLGWIEY